MGVETWKALEESLEKLKRKYTKLQIWLLEETIELHPFTGRKWYKGMNN